jgi:hypothetical protein
LKKEESFSPSETHSLWTPIVVNKLAILIPGLSLTFGISFEVEHSSIPVSA